MRLIRLISLLLLLAAVKAFSLSEKPPSYAVASAHPLATQAGLTILAQGGNAFDAAVAVSAALAVVEPYHSGLGGGGFWLIYDAKHKTYQFIDGREAAPLAAHENLFLDKQGQKIPNLSLNGALAAAIPGEPAALVYLAKHYGRLPLSQSLAPAIHYAETGFAVDPQLRYFSNRPDRLAILRQYQDTANAFLKKGQPYQLNEILKQPDLATTLRLIAEKGRKGFYEGVTAERLVEAVRSQGGIWTLQDLQHYRVKIRAPLQSAYHNMLIITAPPPSAGGTILALALSILESSPMNSFSEVEKIHYLTEAMRLSYWQALKNICDPDFFPIALEKVLSMDNIEALRRSISKDKAGDSRLLKAENQIEPASTNTSHFVIIDKEGNQVAATLSINYIFGAGLVAKGTGVLLNDQMDDFMTKPGDGNVFGVVGNAINKIEPGKRPLSFMTPTILEMPGREALLGTPGGSRIPSMVLLSSLLFYEFKGAISLVSGMRFHHQYLPDVLELEPETFSPDLQEKLTLMGYKLLALKDYYGDMQAITWDKEENILTAASSDPRRIGLAVVN